MSLNTTQKKAIQHKNGPLLIVAGAGTGKTTVLTEKIKYLITQKNVDPQHIFAATFTEKSAEELRNRLDKVMPMGYIEPWVGTFHGLCDRILRAEGLEIGIDPNFRIMTGTDQWLFLKEHLFELELKYYLPLGNPHKFISSLIRFFSRLQDEVITSQDLDKFCRSQKPTTEDEIAEHQRMQELSKAYTKYQQLKHNNGLYDFGDLIGLTLTLFTTRKNILKKYQNQFSHLLVDEFQDTNYAQFELIKLLAPPQNQPNITVVGDDDQSIYKFRGASVSNILEFKDHYPKSSEIVLTDNYRSTQKLLNSAYALIQHNNPDRLETKLNINKKLMSHQKKDQSPQIFEFANGDQEISWIIEQIIYLVNHHQLQFKDIAILGRSNSVLDQFVALCKASDIPYQLIANKGLFDQEEVKNLINLMSVIVNPNDDQLLFQVLASSIYQYDPAQLFNRLQQSKTTQKPLFELISEQDSQEKIITDIQDFQKFAVSHTTTQTLFYLIDQLDYLKSFLQTESVDNQRKINNLNLFLNYIKRFETNTSNPYLHNFIPTLNLWIEAGENPGEAQIEDVDTVSLMTVHAAKGLEFDAIFIPNVIAGRFPSISRKDPIELPDVLVKETLPSGNAHLQEERRLFYVALTRAKRFAYITWSPDYGGKRKRKMSGFASELNLPVKNQSPQIHLSASKPSSTSPQDQSLKYHSNVTSYSQIDTFKACPLKFKYRYILKIPAAPNHTLSFGRTIHQTLHQFHAHQMQGSNLKLNDLLATYEKEFIPEGYDSPAHKKERFQSGIWALTQYFHTYRHKLEKPLLLEQEFKLKITPTITLIGKIDRIDQSEDGPVIIDYKTGESKDQKKVDKDTQLSIYALAAKESLNLKPETLSLLFIETGDIITTTRSTAQIAKVKKTLQKDIENIQTSTFPPKPNYPFPCGYCEYNRICPFAKKPIN